MLLSDRVNTRHQSLPLPLPLSRLMGQLADGSSLTNGWLHNHFGLLRWTVHLLGWLPFGRRIGLARRLRR